MHLKTRNVNTAFNDLVGMIHRGEIPTRVRRGRTGEVAEITEPVTVTYRRPVERVLFNGARDCNPFFHLYESLWMLAGRNDVAPLAYYLPRMRDYSDDGRTLNGAYGHRWRSAKTRYAQEIGGGQTDYKEERVDQLDTIVSHLKADPASRRAVLAVWSVEDDLLRVGRVCNCGADRTGPSAEAHDPGCPARLAPSNDVCCNTHAYFVVEDSPCHHCGGSGLVTDEWSVVATECPCHRPARLLQMTVCNRSNDLTWGMLGANAVHFSFLQEYMAARLGLEVGSYHHFTNNLHVYLDRWEPGRWLGWYDREQPVSQDTDGWLYGRTDVKLVPLVKDPPTFDRLVGDFVGFNSQIRSETQVDRYRSSSPWSEPFLATVAQPACNAWHCHRRGDLGSAMRWCEVILADDWRVACGQWIQRRIDRRAKGG